MAYYYYLNKNDKYNKIGGVPKNFYGERLS